MGSSTQSLVYVSTLCILRFYSRHRFYLKPDWDKLKTREMWTGAAGQILFSLSPGMGTAVALSRSIKLFVQMVSVKKLCLGALVQCRQALT